MICKPCRTDADNQERNMELAYSIFGGEQMTDLEPGEGHDGCEGCDCQHLPVGSTYFLETN